jgi:hypothetical protein
MTASPDRIGLGNAATLLGVSTRSVWTFLKHGILKHYRVGRRFAFDPADVLMLRAQRDAFRSARPHRGAPTNAERLSKIAADASLRQAAIGRRDVAGDAPSTPRRSLKLSSSRGTRLQSTSNPSGPPSRGASRGSKASRSKS